MVARDAPAKLNSNDASYDSLTPIISHAHQRDLNKSQTALAVQESTPVLGDQQPKLIDYIFKNDDGVAQRSSQTHSKPSQPVGGLAISENRSLEMHEAFSMDEQNRTFGVTDPDQIKSHEQPPSPSVQVASLNNSGPLSIKIDPIEISEKYTQEN